MESSLYLTKRRLLRLAEREQQHFQQYRACTMHRQNQTAFIEPIFLFFINLSLPCETSSGDIILSLHQTRIHPNPIHDVHFRPIQTLSAASTVRLVEADTLVLDKSGVSSFLVHSLIGGSVGRVLEIHGFGVFCRELRSNGTKIMRNVTDVQSFKMYKSP